MAKQTLYDRSDSNKLKSIVIAVLFFFFIVFIGWVFGLVTGLSYFGLIIAAVIAVVLIWGEYYRGADIVLGISRAKPVSKKENRELHYIVESLSIAAGIPKPNVYTIDDTAPNAFAIGRDPEHASIVVTNGLMSKLGKYELRGVIAHEMSHIKNYDIRLMMIVTVMVGITALLSDWLIRSLIWGRRGERGRGMGVLAIIGIILVVLSPVIAYLIKLSVSRKREFLADADGALLTRHPQALASALKKIHADKEPLEAANKGTAHLYFDNPLKNYNGFFDKLFSTHPPVEERLKALGSIEVKK